MAKKKLKIDRLWLIVILLVPSVLLNVFLLVRERTILDQGVKVEGVIDGDTLVLEGKGKIRLRYADAPELEYCGGREAKDYLEKLVVGRKVTIKEQIPDQYGRGMALVWRGRTLINKAMLVSGWSRYHHDNSDLTKELKETAAMAIEEKLGIFGKCQSKDIPDKEGCTIKGNIDNNNKTRIYYLPGCSQYNFTVVEKDMGEAWFCTEKEAKKAGFRKAKTC
ncbi:MAG: nuclease [Candidatus Gottesmanbacteria bacterium GW2011_GWA2_43_14]|uniref:Nuclease n=1 Tax=Candidatus Gottesmanbacteria bacterium GW2011_GWA2_43_14 TaxID=1618443 RepID=A0A0G1DK88_9BACT|nr:MAG: nuclease [Candidatus Gottesmanbacteria bacterium GW2011_GWA2_43_14]